MAEKQVPLALSGDEVRKAILFKVEESLKRSCHLADANAYSAFSCVISIKARLDDFGRHVTDNHIVTVEEGEVSPETPPLEATVEVLEAAPNVVRIETEQPIPIKTVQDGKTVIKNAKYQPRKK